METKAARFEWYSAIQFCLSLLAALAALTLALLFLAQVNFQTFGVFENPEGLTSLEQATQTLVMAASSGLVGLLLLPSAVFSLMRLMGKPIAERLIPSKVQRAVLLFLVLVVMPAMLWIGDWSIRSGSFVWLLLPIAHVLVVGIPVLWLVNLGRHGLPELSPQRIWGVLAGGLVVGPLLLIVLEFCVGLVMVIGFALVAVIQPGQIEILQGLTEGINPTTVDPQAFTPLVEAYFRQPLVIYLIFTFLAVIVPLLEELFKPVGVWLLASRPLTPPEGFIAGAVSGAGMALFESLGYGGAAGIDWTVIVIARSGTAVMHIFTAGLMGWALASAWAERRYVRLGLVYLMAVFVHGLWNGLTVALGLMSLQDPLQTAVTVAPIAVAQMWLVAIFGAALLFSLLGFNRILQRGLAHIQTADAPLAALPAKLSDLD